VTQPAGAKTRLVTPRSRKTIEEARKELREALALAPWLGAAELALARIDLRLKDPAAAQGRLKRLVSLDPSYLAAKRALYALDARPSP